MIRATDEVYELKRTLLEYKKELMAVKESNQLLKVKIRKQESDINKKEQQIESLLHPAKQAGLAKRLMAERGATVIMKLKEENLKLEKNLCEKELLISRLRKDMQTMKAYGTQGMAKKKYSISKKKNDNLLDLGSMYTEGRMKKYNPGSASFKMSCLSLSSIRSTVSNPETRHSIDSFKSTTNLDNNFADNNLDINKNAMQYEGLSREQLIELLENLKQSNNSPVSDIKRNDATCESPHKEVQQLQNYFLDMISEVNHLKSTISKLQTEQEKTADLLKEKESAQELTKLSKVVRKSKPTKSSSGIKVKPHQQKTRPTPRQGSHKNSNQQEDNILCEISHSNQQKAVPQVIANENREVRIPSLMHKFFPIISSKVSYKYT